MRSSRVPSLYVLIPALNEAPNVRRLFRDLAEAQRALAERFSLRVVLIDDGSSDGTADAAMATAGPLELQILRHEVPRGPGQAFASGFARIEPLIRDDDLVLTLEADNTSRLDVFSLMAHRIREGHDVVFASPYAYGGGIVSATRLRTLLSHLANSFVKGALGIRGLLTVSSFYRLYRGSTIRRLQRVYGKSILECAGFECMVELVLKLMYLDMTISEVPMTLDAGQRLGRSKMRIGKAGVGYLRLFRLKRRWRAVGAGEARQLDRGWPPREDALASQFELLGELEGRVAETAMLQSPP